MVLVKFKIQVLRIYQFINNGYSVLKATAGSFFAARRAGIRLAISSNNTDKPIILNAISAVIFAMPVTPTKSLITALIIAFAIKVTSTAITPDISQVTQPPP